MIISGGGTGGHIFPAVSIANAVKTLRPDAKILFVGALGRMEMQRVPAAGYDIKGLPIRGFLRPLWKLGNIGVALDYLKSKMMAKQLLRQFQPQVAVGVGGYASSAALGAATGNEHGDDGQNQDEGYEVPGGLFKDGCCLAYAKSLVCGCEVGCKAAVLAVLKEDDCNQENGCDNNEDNQYCKCCVHILLLLFMSADQ